MVVARGHKSANQGPLPSVSKWFGSEASQLLLPLSCSFPLPQTPKTFMRILFALVVLSLLVPACGQPRLRGAGKSDDNDGNKRSLERDRGENLGFNNPWKNSPYQNRGTYARVCMDIYMYYTSCHTYVCTYVSM